MKPPLLILTIRSSSKAKLHNFGLLMNSIIIKASSMRASRTLCSCFCNTTLWCVQRSPTWSDIHGSAMVPLQPTIRLFRSSRHAIRKYNKQTHRLRLKMRVEDRKGHKSAPAAVSSSAKTWSMKMQISRDTTVRVKPATPMKRKCSYKRDLMSIVSILWKLPRFSRHSRLIFCSKSLPNCSKMRLMMQNQMRSRRGRLSLKSSHLIGGWSSLCSNKWTRMKFRMSHRTSPTLMLLKTLCQLALRRTISKAPTRNKSRKRRPWYPSTSKSKCKPRSSVFPTKQSLPCNSLARAVILCVSSRMWRSSWGSCRSTTMQVSKKRMRAPNDLFLLTLTPRVITSNY